MIAVALSGALFLAAVQSANASQKTADCVAAPRDTPTLDVNRVPSARFKVINSVIGSEDFGKVELVYPRGIETAVLKSGVKVRIELGGCETWGTTYEFELPSETHRLDDGRYWFDRAIALLDEVEAVSRPDSMRFNRLRALLNGDRRASARHDFSKGELIDEITFPKDGHKVGVRRKNGVSYLTVGYYVPL